MQELATQSASSVAPVELAELPQGQGKGKSLIERRMDLIKHIKVSLHVRIGEAELSVSELLALKSGSTVKFDRLVNDPMDLILEGQVVGRGELVAVGDSLGFRLSEVSVVDI